MFFSKIRFLIGVIIIAIGAAIHFTEGIGSAWYMYLGGVIILLTHFLFGNVSLAFNKLNKGQVDEAEDLILQIKRPDWLLKRHRAYYYFVLGIIAFQKKQSNFIEQHFKQALELGLRSDTDHALAALHIARVNFDKKNYTVANEYRLKAQNFNSNDLKIKENLERLEQALKGFV